MSWKVKGTTRDGRKSYINRNGNNFARVWEIVPGYTWAVYRGTGSNEVAAGSCNNLQDAKARAESVLKGLK